MTISLRPYQVDVVKPIAAYYQEGMQGVLLQMPTGAGKTRTASYVVEKYSSTGRQVLWLVHREELLMQAALTFAEYGIKHSLICADSSARAIKAQQFREFGKSFVDQGSNVIVASIQTIVRRVDKPGKLDWLDPAQIIADECHLSLAVTWRKVLGKWPKARLLGLTATPTRLDRQSFARTDGGLYDVLVPGPTPRELIDWGNLAKFKVYAPPIHFVEGVKVRTKGGDHDPKDLEKELDSKVVYGDVIEHYRKYSHGKPAIAFCPTVAVAQKFADAFNEAGYRAISLDGETDDAVRRQSLQKLGRGEIDVVTSVSILVEGTDVPYATTALMLRRTESLSLYLQAIGRVLRPHPDKEHAIILDFVGVTAIHGMPDEEREWTLDGAPKRKKEPNAANDNEQDVAIQTCPKCFTIHLPAPECPTCGHIYPARERKEMKQVDGDLVEITQEQAEQMRRQRRAMQGKAQTEDELVDQGISRSQARKIIAARLAKAEMVDGIMSALESVKSATGQGPYGAFGVTFGEIRKMKPKDLKALRLKIDDRLAELAAKAA